MSFEVKLPNFEGPLDLLLYLIKKNKINIYDIPISEITHQYINHLNSMASINIDSVSEFLVMASTLLEIKSKMLLPKQEEEIDPRQELVERLIEYQKYKNVAIYLRENHPYKEVYKREFIDTKVLIEDKNDLKLDVNTLFLAYKNVLSKQDKTIEFKDNRIEEITKKQQISIFKVIKAVLEHIKKKGVTYFSNLIDGINKEEIIYRFLAVLELGKLGKIITHQEKMFEDIKITKR